MVLLAGGRDDVGPTRSRSCSSSDEQLDDHLGSGGRSHVARLGWRSGPPALRGVLPSGIDSPIFRVGH